MASVYFVTDAAYQFPLQKSNRSFFLETITFMIIYMSKVNYFIYMEIYIIRKSLKA
jgi:hypothetical protein